MTTTELVPAVNGGDILLPADVDAVRAAITAYHDVTRAVLDPADWQGPPGEDGSFVKKSGWQTIAKAYRLSTEIVSETADHDPDGQILRAGCVVRAIAPNGQHREATGYCDQAEPRFRGAGRNKLENDVRTTAETRATNRAISNLTGFGAVSAEEVDQGASDDPHAHAAAGALPGWAQPGDVGHAANLLVAILQAADADTDRVTTIGKLLFDRCGGTIPVCVVGALDLIADAIPEPIPDAQVEVQA